MTSPMDTGNLLPSFQTPRVPAGPFGVFTPPQFSQQLPRTYYVSAAGSDAADGLTPATAWLTVAKVNSSQGTFLRGDHILFRRGDTFSGTLLYITTGGTSVSPIVYGCYGVGTRPTISITNNSAIYIEAVGGIVIRDFICVGSTGGTAFTSSGGIAFYAATGRRDGITVENCDVSQFQHGITVGGAVATDGFSNVRINECDVHGNRDTGIYVYGPGYNPGAPAWLHRNVQVTKCRAYQNLGNSSNTTSHSGSGVIIGSTDGGIIDQCTAYGNGTLNAYVGGGPAGLWCYASRGITIQRSLSYSNRSGTGADGDGYDLDIDSINCVVQYNLAYDNDGAGLLLWGLQSNTAWDDNIVRYNMFWGNGRGTSSGFYGEITMGGNLNNSKVYNNTLYSKDLGGTAISTFTMDTGTAVNIKVWNNIFFSSGTGHLVDSATNYASTAYLFQNNAYWRPAGFSVQWVANTYTSLATWRAAIANQEQISAVNVGLTVDPKMLNPSATPTITNVYDILAYYGLELLPNSSDVDGGGVNLLTTFGENPGLVDYYQNLLDTPASFVGYSMGAHEQTYYFPNTADFFVVRDSYLRAGETLRFGSIASSDDFVTQIDSAGLTDSPVKTRSLAYIDSSGLTDTEAALESQAPVDSVGLTDVSTISLTHVIAQVDSSGLTDTTAAAEAASPVDSSGLTDVIAKDRLLDYTDSAGLTDTTAAAETAAPVDSVGLTDLTAINLVYGILQVDSSGLTDTTAAAEAASPVDNAGLTDVIAKTVSQANIDSSGLTDAEAALESQAPVDSVGLTDVSTVNLIVAITQVDSSGLTDTYAITRTLLYTDSAGLTDTQATAEAQAPIDSVGLTDQSTVVSARQIVQEDSAGLTDTSGTDRSLVYVDNAGLTDTTADALLQTDIDSAGLTDVIVKAISPASIDSAGLTDTSTVTPEHGIPAVDSAGLTDTTTTSRAPAYVDSVGLVDAFAPAILSAPTDSTGLTDVSALSAGRMLVVEDSTGLTDGEGTALAQLTTESVGLTDVVEVLRSLPYVDSAGLTDFYANTVAPNPIDSAGLTDTSSIAVQGGVTPIDSAGLTDVTATVVSQVTTDSAGLTDSPIKDRLLAYTDSSGLTDTSLVEAGRLVTPVDSVGLTDTQVMTRSIVNTDDTGLTDTPSDTVSIARTDSAGLTDTYLAEKFAFVTQIDSAGLTDLVPLLRQLEQIDSIGLTDVTTSAYARIFVDSAGLSDTYIAATNLADSSDMMVFFHSTYGFHTYVRNL